MTAEAGRLEVKHCQYITSATTEKQTIWLFRKENRKVKEGRSKNQLENYRKDRFISNIQQFFIKAINGFIYPVNATGKAYL